MTKQAEQPTATERTPRAQQSPAERMAERLAARTAPTEQREEPEEQQEQVADNSLPDEPATDEQDAAPVESESDEAAELPEGEQFADFTEEQLADVVFRVDDRDVTLDELKSGYMMRADYTRKRQAEAAQVREQTDTLKRAEVAYVQAIEQAFGADKQALQQFDQSVNWSQLQQTDPAAYQQKAAERAQMVSRLQQADQAYRQFVEGVRTREQQARRQDAQRAIETLTESVPGGWDQAKYDSLRGFMTSRGDWLQMDEASFNKLTDPVVLGLIEENKRLKDEVSAGRTKGKKRLAQASAKITKTNADRQQQTARARDAKAQRAKLAKSGKWQDAAALFANRIR